MFRAAPLATLWHTFPKGVRVTTLTHPSLRVSTDIAGVTIRPSTADDWAEVAAFLDRHREASRHSALSPENATPSFDMPASRNTRGGMFVAEWDGAISGLPTIVGLVAWRVFGRRHSERADLALVTAGGWAARGVASELVAIAAQDAQSHGIHAFLIPVIPRNGALRAAAIEAGLSERRCTTQTRDEVEILLVGDR